MKKIGVVLGLFLFSFVLDVKAMVQDDEDEEGYFTVQAFVFSGEEGEAQMTNTIGW